MKLKSKKQNKEIRITFLVDEEEYNRIEAKAMLYAEGNISKWCRYSSENCVPEKKDLEK